MNAYVPRRRLRLLLDLQADSLEELATALTNIGRDLLIEDREEREKDSGGWASGYHLELTCDEQMDGDTYRSRLREWADDRRAKRAALTAPYVTNEGESNAQEH